MEQQSVDPVHGLGHFLQHEHVPCEVRLQRRAEQVAQHRHVERRCLVPPADRRLQRLRRGIDQPAERPADRHLPAFPENVLRHRPVRDGLEARPIQTGEQRPGIAVAQIGLAPGGLGQSAQDRFRHPTGAVAPARAPDRVIALVIGDLEESPGPRCVVAGEMPVRGEALRTEMNLRRWVRVERCGEVLHARGDLCGHARPRRDHTDLAALGPHPTSCVICTRSATPVDSSDESARRLLFLRGRR